jgi:hypothetical protein
LFTTSSWAQISIYSQDFEGSGMPDGWTQETNATDEGWLFGTGSQFSSVGYSIPDHTNIAVTNDDACNCDKSNDILMTPAMDFSSNSNVSLQFDAYFGHLYYNSQEEAYVLASTDGGTTWTTVYTLAGSADWVTHFVDLSAYTGNSSVVIGFKYDDGGGWGYGFALDNVSIFAPLSIDAGLIDITPSNADYDTYNIAGTSYTLGGTLTNYGVNTIISFTAKYSDGINTYSDTYTGLNIAPLSSYTFELSTPFVIPSDGVHYISLWVRSTSC